MKIDFKILDGLRGIAATYVLINHCRGNLLIGGTEYAQVVPVENWTLGTKIYYSILQLTSLGKEFVVFFFVLSGFSIAHSLVKNTNIFSFYKRRFIRLYLPFLVALVWAALVHAIIVRTVDGFLKPSVFETPLAALKNLLYIPNGALIGQFWSLPMEVIFYLLAPFLLISSSSRKIYYIISVAVYIFSLFRVPYGTTGTSIPGEFLLDYNIFFAAGIFLYYNFDRICRIRILTNKFLFIGSSIMLFALMIVFRHKIGPDNKPGLLVAMLFSFVMILNFLKYRIHTGILGVLGKMSYTIYLTHFASLYFFASILIYIGIIPYPVTNIWYVWLLAIPFALILSIPFYLIAERPTKKWLGIIKEKHSFQKM